MFYSNKSFLESLFVVVLFLLLFTKAAADDLPRQIKFLQVQLTDANKKIAALESDQQSISGKISALQTGLNGTHQEISNLKNNGALNHNQLLATTTLSYRTANGHGR